MMRTIATAASGHERAAGGGGRKVGGRRLSRGGGVVSSAEGTQRELSEHDQGGSERAEALKDDVSDHRMNPRSTRASSARPSGENAFGSAARSSTSAPSRAARASPALATASAFESWIT